MSRLRRAGVSTDVAVGALLAAGFALVVFVATGGTDLGPNTWVQIALLVVAAGCAVTLLIVRPRGRIQGAAALGLFAALAALTYASIAWSVQPATSWTEANRTLSYLAAFGGAVALARLVPARWPALVGAIGTVAVVACGYALLTKVFPGSLDAADTFGRLRLAVRLLERHRPDGGDGLARVPVGRRTTRIRPRAEGTRRPVYRDPHHRADPVLLARCAARRPRRPGVLVRARAAAPAGDAGAGARRGRRSDRVRRGPSPITRSPTTTKR